MTAVGPEVSVPTDLRTPIAPTEGAAPPVDPHTPKLSPDDPRLRLRRPVARTLRTGPILGLAGIVIGAILVATALAVQTPAPARPTRPETSGAPPAPSVPDAIRNASASPPPHPSASPVATPPRRPGPVGRPDLPDEHRLRAEQELRAQNSGILFDRAAGPSEAATPRGADSPRSSSAETTAPTVNRPPSGGADSDPNGQDRKNAFLDGLGARSSDYLPTVLQHPRSPYELKAGTIIPAVLITAIGSDLPGPVIGQVRENVYDTATGNFLLIPQGARLLAHYDSMVAWGQERVLLCWNRLILPNGDSLDLQCMPAADLEGAAGLTDQVDEHWFRIIKGAAVASLLAATTQAVAGNTQGFSPTVPQMWASGAASEVNQVGQQVTRRNLMIQPTITVRPGYSVNVIVTKDTVVPPYQPAEGAAL